jgi:hypothetical protein
MTHDVTSAPSIAALRKVHSPWMDVGRSLAAALGILTAGFETGYDSLKADDLVLQDADLMLSAIYAIDTKFHVAGLKPLKEMAETGEFVSGGRFVHAQSFTGPVLGFIFGARVTRQPQTTNAIRTARKIASSRVSVMLILRRPEWGCIALRRKPGSLGLSGLTKWSILNRLILSMRARFSAVSDSV